MFMNAFAITLSRFKPDFYMFCNRNSRTLKRFTMHLHAHQKQTNRLTVNQKASQTENVCTQRWRHMIRQYTFLCEKLGVFFIFLFIFYHFLDSRHFEMSIYVFFDDSTEFQVKKQFRCPEAKT